MEALAAKIVLILLVVNSVLAGLDLAFTKLKEILPTPGVNKASDIVHAALDGLKKVLDFVSANQPHA